MEARPLDLRPVGELVRRRTGLGFDDSPQGRLAMAVANRLEATRSLSASSYYARLLASAEEFEALLALLTVKETYFFRDPTQIALLVDHLIPELLARRQVQGLPLRLVSAGCSTGEEPYSIAMALLDRFGPGVGRLISIVGGDIDPSALAKATKGEYRDFSFRSMPPELLARHFSATSAQTWLLDPDVKKLVEFRPLNLLDWPASGLTDLDVVFFRNVSIYFDRPTLEGVQRSLRQAMREGGYLFVGSAETLANDLGFFQLVSADGQFYFTAGPGAGDDSPEPRGGPAHHARRLPEPPAARTPAESRALLPDGGTMTPSLEALPQQQAVAAEREDAQGQVAEPPSISSARETVRQLIRDKRFREAQAEVLSRRERFPDDLDLLLLEGHIQIQLRKFEAAESLAAQVLAHDSWSVDAHMLLALAARGKDDATAAVSALKAVIYARPDCWPAHYFLAGTLYSTDGEQARREYRIALRQLAADPDPDGRLGLPLDLPVQDIRALCERRAGMTTAHLVRER